jgi:hypothetical protein
MTDVAKLIDDYAAGPKLLRDAVKGMTVEQLKARPVPGRWSTLELVCHIADFEPVYADRMKRIVVENEPTMFGGDPDAFAARLAYHQRDLETELAMIEAVRRHVVTILRTLTPEDFSRVGRHSSDGPLTLTTILQRIANHIPHHLPFIMEKRQALGV